jgi:Flp pilus assembly protein TadD
MLPEAEYAYRKALAINPTHRETLENLGYCLLLAKRYAEAEEFLTTLVHAHPDSYRGQVRMALARLARGDAVGAEAFARRALAIEPGNETATTVLQEALRLQGKAPVQR